MSHWHRFPGFHFPGFRKCRNRRKPPETWKLFCQFADVRKPEEGQTRRADHVLLSDGAFQRGFEADDQVLFAQGRYFNPTYSVSWNQCQHSVSRELGEQQLGHQSRHHDLRIFKPADIRFAPDMHRPHGTLLLSIPMPLVYTGHSVFAALALASMIKYVIVRSITLWFWLRILTLPFLQVMCPECSRITFQAVEAAICRVISASLIRLGLRRWRLMNSPHVKVVLALPSEPAGEI